MSACIDSRIDMTNQGAWSPNRVRSLIAGFWMRHIEMEMEMEKDEDDGTEYSGEQGLFDQSLLVLVPSPRPTTCRCKIGM